MGKRGSQKKKAALLDNYDPDNLSSSSSSRSDSLTSSSSSRSDSLSSLSSSRSNNTALSSLEDILEDRDSSLDQCVDALYEKRGSTREKALALIIDAFNKSLQHEFAEKMSTTLLHQCLHSIKKGSAKEVALASHVIGLLALTMGPGEIAQEILDESVSHISKALASRLQISEMASLLACLAVITFVGGEEPEHTEKSMQIMWQVVHPMRPNVAAAKPSPAMINTVVSAWSFLLTTMDERTLNPKSWQKSMSYFCTLLDKDDRSVRIAAGEALALIFEIGSLEKFCGELKVSEDTPVDEHNFRKAMYIDDLKSKVICQVRDLSAESGGRGSCKKDLNNQRNTFRDILNFLENGYSRETSMKIAGESLDTYTWSALIQLNFMKHFLGGGFLKHMQENTFLHDVFGFTPKKKTLGDGYRMSAREKRMYKSQNSAVNKARTKLLSKQRMLSQY